MRILIKYLLPAILFTSILLMHCANPVTPQGGPKDVEPPQVIHTEPPNFTTSFKGSEIRLTFDEFISLKSPVTEIFISPPLPKPPKYKLRGKTVLIQFEDTLAPNTTYSINLGKSISDITEGNILLNPVFVFSTGPVIDSLQISGMVIDAFTTEPKPEVFVMLFSDNNDTIPFDSLPYKMPPHYLTRSNENGQFFLANLAMGQYKLFAIEDKSGDLLFNSSDEYIAFADSLISPARPLPVAIDDTLTADSITTDTTQGHPGITSIDLRMFEEIDSTQEILKAELVKKDQFRIVLKYATENITMTPINLDSNQSVGLLEISPHGDTLYLWNHDSIPDSLYLSICVRDTCFDSVLIAPTRPKEKFVRKKKEEAPEPPPPLSIVWKPRAATFNHFKYTLSGEVSYPVSEISKNPFLLIEGTDTVRIPRITFTDSVYRHFQIDYPWKENQAYTILLPDSCLMAFNGISHDTIVHQFKTASARDLGTLILKIDISQKPGQYLIQLINEQGNKVEETSIDHSGEVKFPMIQPGKYTIKAILDLNKNGFWDTGNYLKKLQPEWVFFFPAEIEIRGNWDVEEDWKIQSH